MNPIKKLAGQTAIYGLSNIIGRLLNYLLVPLYTRVFAPAEYGVVAELSAYVALLYVVLIYGMETAYFRYCRSEKDALGVYRTAAWSLFATSMLFIVIVLFFAESIASGLGYADHPEYIRWFAIIIGVDAFMAIPFARLRQENRPLRFASIKLINIGANIGLNLLFILSFPWLLRHSTSETLKQGIDLLYNPQTGVGYIFIATLISSILTLFFLLPELRAMRGRFDLKLWKQMIAYALPLLVMGLSGSINESFDRVLLKHMLPDPSTAMEQLGIYGACYKISILMTIFIQTFRFAAEPFFFGESDKSDARKTYAQVMNYFVIICLVIFLATTLYLETVRQFVGKAYYPGLDVVPVLLLANLFLGVFYNLSIWYKLTNRTIFGAYISLIGAGVTLLTNFLLIPVMGYMGAAWSHFICYATLMILSWALGQKHYPVPYNLRKIGLYFGVALLIYGANEWIKTLVPGFYLFRASFFMMLFIAFVLWEFRSYLPFRRKISI